jgi:hypothetical protein
MISRTKFACLLLALTVLSGCRGHHMVDLFVILPLHVAAVEHKKHSDLDLVCNKLSNCGKFSSFQSCLDHHSVYALPEDCLDILRSKLGADCELIRQYLDTSLCQPGCSGWGYRCMGDYLHLCRDGLKVKIDCRQLCRKKAKARSPSPSCGHNNKLGHATCLCAKSAD